MHLLTKHKSKPFLKWAGGKTQLLPEIEKRFPFGKNDSFSYVEPFIGSGAVLFWLLDNYPNIQQIIINDANADLSMVYQILAEHVEEVINYLETWQKEYHAVDENSEAKKIYYYQKRDLFNDRQNDKIVQSALVIFLNRTCYNGLFRVNRANQFNVPIGSYKKPLICDADNLYAVSEKLRNVKILQTDFEETLNFIDHKAFFYFDPPYKPLSKTSSFNAYSHNEFDDNEQIRLKNFCDLLHQQGHLWLLSNSDPRALDADNHFFDNLYGNYTIERVLASRNINSRGDRRGKLTELLIRNY